MKNLNRNYSLRGKQLQLQLTHTHKKHNKFTNKCAK